MSITPQEFEKQFLASATPLTTDGRSKPYNGQTLVFPLLGKAGFHVVSACACDDLKLYAVRGEHGRECYSVCAAHRIQPLGRLTLIKTARNLRNYRLATA